MWFNLEFSVFVRSQNPQKMNVTIRGDETVMGYHVMPLFVSHLKKLYHYIDVMFRRQADGATFNNNKRETLGFFGHVKLMEAQAFLFEATRDEMYLTHLKEGIEFCRKRTVKRGIEDWWSVDSKRSSGWIESNHLGILALSVYRYWHITGDRTYNSWVEQLMMQIPKNRDETGTYKIGYSTRGREMDDRRYLADHAELLIGFYSLWKMTGREEYRKRYKDIFLFLDKGFRALDVSGRHAWVVGPYSIPYGEGTSKEICNKSHTTYSQFFISRDIVLTEEKERYDKLVQSTDWMLQEARFQDGLFGYNRKDDKMLGWSIYAACQTYWAYLLTRRDGYFLEAMETIQAVLTKQQANGSIPPFIPHSHTIDWTSMEKNAAGLGEIWQLTAILEGLSLCDLLLKPRAVSVWQLHEGDPSIKDVLYEEDKRTLHIALTGEHSENESYRIISPSGQFIRFVCSWPTKIKHGYLSDGRPFIDIWISREQQEETYCTFSAIHE
jgi:hypothetical protein